MLAPATNPRATDGQEIDDGSIKLPYNGRGSRGNPKGVVENAREEDARRGGGELNRLSRLIVDPLSSLGRQARLTAREPCRCLGMEGLTCNAT